MLCSFVSSPSITSVCSATGAGTAPLFLSPRDSYFCPTPSHTSFTSGLCFFKDLVPLLILGLGLGMANWVGQLMPGKKPFLDEHLPTSSLNTSEFYFWPFPISLFCSVWARPNYTGTFPCCRWTQIISLALLSSFIVVHGHNMMQMWFVGQLGSDTVCWRWG